VQAQLIEDLLDVSRIIAGNFKLEKTDADLVAIVRAALDALQPMVASNEISLHLDLPPVAPLRGRRNALAASHLESAHQRGEIHS
jgi:signal transduction histidine kinase